MNIPFWKMHGAGNDFILVDDRERSFPADDGRWLAAVSKRRTGVGCEGIILIQPSDRADFRMRFFNPDGTEVEMCGNGARCVARLAHEIGAAPATMSIETVAGILGAETMGNTVRIELTPPTDWRMDTRLEIDGKTLTVHFVNTGVPHAVVEVEDLEACDVVGLGAAIRHHDAFAPAGTNANFMDASAPGAVRVRTYERGVEAETLACGTGIAASALVAATLGKVSAPVTVLAASGDSLTVGFELGDTSADKVTLCGPALHVFRGTLDHP